MRKVWYGSAAVLVCCLVWGFHSVHTSSHHHKKCFLDEKSIKVTKEGIIVETASNPIKVKTLRTTSRGVYVYKQDICAEGKKKK